MKQGIFSFALLQYHHSQILGEILNIGLVAYFPDQNVVRFLRPEKLTRLRFTYADVQEKTIKTYLRYFEKKVSELNANPKVFTNYNLSISLSKFLHSEFLPEDSSTLQFGPERKSVLYTEDLDVICSQLYNLYFSVFEIKENAAQSPLPCL